MKNWKAWFILPAFLCAICCGDATQAGAAATVGQWGIFEVKLKGPATGNPFLDVTVSGHFTCGQKSVDADGFYDGDGVYIVRFMPEEQGDWSYEIRSNAAELNGKTGSFACGAPETGNHGPVRVANHFHFKYADGTPYFEIGTTAYNWTNQTEARERQTLETLKSSPFNKVRMCVLPSEYDVPTTATSQPVNNVPVLFAFEGKPMKDWDFAHFFAAVFS